ncbi:MAG: hypothetical protein AB1651_18060 [Pseudomonadota bacterium]
MNIPEIINAAIQSLPVNSVLRERLQFALERHVAAEVEISVLRAEFQDLKSQLEQRHRDVESLKKKIIGLESKFLPFERVLLAASEIDEPSIEAVAKSMGASKGVITHAVGELRDRGMVEANSLEITKDGYRYLSHMSQMV